VTDLEIIPFQSQQLPSAALSWLAGGEVMTASDDESGLRSTEPFFLIYSQFGQRDSTLFHGQSGRLRLSLSAEPLLWQLWREVRQLVQKRYQI